MVFFRTFIVLAAVLVAAPAALAQDAPAAMPTTAAKCLSCHGADGRPALADVPIIAGQQELYLVNALKAYRDGNRAFGQALVMAEMTRTLSDADIAALAKWFGDQQ
jgi:cytochrome c553